MYHLWFEKTILIPLDTNCQTFIKKKMKEHSFAMKKRKENGLAGEYGKRYLCPPPQ